MHLKQLIFFVTELFVITCGFEIISTSTEKGPDKDKTCTNEIIKTLGKNLEEQQNFCMAFYNNSVELQNQKQSEEARKQMVQLFDNKLEEVKTEILNKIEKITPLAQKHDKLPRNCLEVLKRGNTVSGVYKIQPSSTSGSFDVRCNMDARGGGWTYFLDRFDGSQEFFLNWQDYKRGFGNLSAEFWLGLQHVYELTGSTDNNLLVELIDWDNKYYYAEYNMFRLGSEEDGYPIKALSGYKGDAGDSLTYHKSSRFSTHDRDQDENPVNCANLCHGAWWYKSCHHSNLAGTYFNSAKEDSIGMVWYHIKSKYLSLKEARMLIRPHFLCH